jgi:hypothetical protein
MEINFGNSQKRKQNGLSRLFYITLQTFLFYEKNIVSKIQLQRLFYKGFDSKKIFATNNEADLQKTNRRLDFFIVMNSI